MILLKTFALGLVVTTLLLLLLIIAVYIERTEWLQNISEWLETILYIIILVMMIGMVAGLILGIY